MRRVVPLLVLLAVGAPLRANADEPRGPIAIGVVAPLSGEFGSVGKQLVEAAQIAAAEVGATVVFADTEGEPAKAVEAVAQLASRPDVVAIVGPLGRRESQAAAATAQRFAIPLFTLTSWEATNRAGGWVFRVRNSPAEQATFVAQVARHRLGLETAAVLYPKTEFGDEATRAFVAEFTRAGGRVTAATSYPDDTTDYTTVLEVLVGKKAYLGKKGSVGKWRTDAHGFVRTGRAEVDFQALFVPDFHHRVARLLAFLPVAGLQNGDGGDGVAVQLLGVSGWQGKSMELAGGVAAGALYPDTFAGVASGGRAEEFSRTFESTTGRRPVDIEAETFDIVWLLGGLAAQARSAPDAKTDVKSLRAAVVRSLPRKQHWVGVSGGIRFARDGAPLRDLQMYRFDADGHVSPAE